jgi:hypothetical protein
MVCVCAPARTRAPETGGRGAYVALAFARAWCTWKLGLQGLDERAPADSLRPTQHERAVVHGRLDEFVLRKQQTLELAVRGIISFELLGFGTGHFMLDHEVKKVRTARYVSRMLLSLLRDRR